MDTKEFYAEKKKLVVKLTRELIAGKYPGQPDLEDGVDPETDEPIKVPIAVFITSVRKREAGTIDGHVCEATVETAAYRIADQTHRISTEAEIKGYLLRQAKQKLFHDKQETKNGIQRTMRVSPNEVDPMPAHLAAALANEVKQPVQQVTTKR